MLNLIFVGLMREFVPTDVTRSSRDSAVTILRTLIVRQPPLAGLLCVSNYCRRCRVWIVYFLPFLFGSKFYTNVAIICVASFATYLYHLYPTADVAAPSC